MNRRRGLAIGGTVAAVAAATTLVVALRGNGGENAARDGSRVVPTDADFTIGTRDTPYRIVYRLDDLSDDAVRASTDEVWVRPPFESRLETSTDGKVDGVQIAAMDRLRLGSLDEPLVIARVPGLAVSDVRVRPILGDALDAGLLERREQRVVAGRRCQVLRSGTLLGGGPLVPITDAEHADSCIDHEGLLLEEVLHHDGEPTLHRIAIDVDLEPSLAPDHFDAGDIVLPADEGGGSSLEVDPDAGSEGPFWVLPDNRPPSGFERVARLSIVPPQPERFSSGTDPAIVAGTADVFVRGPDLLVVYQGGTVGRVDAFPPTLGAPTVDGGDLGDGELLLSALGSELRFPQPRGRFVHVIGTLPTDDLRAIARSLTQTQGTGLVFLDHQPSGGG